jgi:hypothetical protein
MGAKKNPYRGLVGKSEGEKERKKERKKDTGRITCKT